MSSKPGNPVSDICSAKPQGISPGDVGLGVCIVSGGGGTGAPHGISPAKAEHESINVIAVVIRNLFMEVSPVVGFTMQGFLHQID